MTLVTLTLNTYQLDEIEHAMIAKHNRTQEILHCIAHLRQQLSQGPATASSDPALTPASPESTEA